MPEFGIYLAVGALVTGALCWVVAGSLLAIAGARRAATAVRHLTAPPDSSVRMPCHTTRCGHLTTRHDMTDAGLICRDCGHLVAGP